nr:MAG TPA: IcmL-like IV secretion system, protein [Caudoviricetes sp.]
MTVLRTVMNIEGLQIVAYVRHNRRKLCKCK